MAEYLLEGTNLWKGATALQKANLIKHAIETAFDNQMPLGDAVKWMKEVSRSAGDYFKEYAQPDDLKSLPGENNLSPGDQAAQDQANTKTLGGMAGEFIKGNEGSVLIPEKFRAAVQYAHDSIRRAGGVSFPEIARLSGKAATAVYNLATTKTAVEEGQSYYGDTVLGRHSTEAQERMAGTVWLELRARDTKARHAQYAQADMNDARKAVAAGDHGAAADYIASAKAHIQAARDTWTCFTQADSPIKSSADWVAALNDPYVRDAVAKYKQHYVPYKEATYRDSQGLNDYDPINSFTQIKDMPVRAIALDDQGQPYSQPNSKGPITGNLGNVKARKNPASYQATLAHERYELNGRKIIEQDIAGGVPVARKAVAYRTLESEGLGEWRKPGERGPLANGNEARMIEDVDPPKNTQANARGETRFWVDKEAYPGFRRALAVDQPGAWEKGLALAMHIPGVAALVSSVEMAYHGTNLAMSMTHESDFRDIVKKPMDFYKNLHGFLTSNPAYQKRVMDAAEMGRIKGGQERPGLLIPNWLEALHPGLQAKDPTKYAGKFLHAYDQIVRMTLSDGFDRLVARGHQAAGDDMAKTNFINQLAGNYNGHAMSSLVKFLRESRLQPFAVAASGMTLRSIRNLAGGGNVGERSLSSNIHLRAAVISQLVALPVAGMIANYLTTGQVMPDGIPYGGLYTGQDEKGNKRFLDLLGIVGIRRGATALGIAPTVEHLRQGHSTGEAVSEGATKAAHAWLHTVFGPGPQFVYTSLFGEDAPGGKQVAKAPDYEAGETKIGQQIKAASLRANPVIGVVSGASEPGHEMTGREKFMKMLGPIGERTAYPQQPPEVNRFREILAHDLDAYKEQATSSKREGLRAREPRGLVILNEANQFISNLERLYNRKDATPEQKSEIRQRQATIAQRAMERRKAFLERAK